MKHPSSFIPYRPKVRATTKGAADFLQLHDKMAVLLPTVTRMVALQKDCAATLPAMFDTCAVLQFESGQLVLSTPTAALAAKLKQQLPKLQEGLLQRGWQISAIRLKVQLVNNREKPVLSKQLTLPGQAIAALANLDSTLEDSPRNEALKAAITAMMRRHLDSNDASQ
jgi:hypothetical protein